MDTICHRVSLDHSDLMEQLKVFFLRVQTCRQSNNTSDVLTLLSSHIDLLQQITSSDQLAVELSKFSLSLQSNANLATCFLAQFMNYIQSTIDLEENLDTIKETVIYLLPCIHVALKKQPKEQTLTETLGNDHLLSLYKCVVNTFQRESLYKEGSITDMLKYQSNEDRTVKAHIVRMSQGDSKRMFQETFCDGGSISSLYLIYIWQIYMIYEIKEGSVHPTIHSLTHVMEKSGKYVAVVPDKDLKKMALTDPLSPTGRYHKILTQSDKMAALHPIPDLDFEWTDFRIGVLHPNGVVFLANSGVWQERLKKISSTIEGLEVKRFLRYTPALGSTFALPLKGQDVNFIRVRVVRVTQSACQVYGVDTGSVHQCRPRDLVLLPASIINLPPCGRLARLPVVPSPASSSVAPGLALLAALAQHTSLTLSLSPEDIRQSGLWLQVAELTLPTLHLLKGLTHTPVAHHLPTIACVAADYLMRLTEQRQPSQEAATLLCSILTLAMHKSPKMSLMLAKRGLFPALCEAALAWRCEDAWICIKALFGRKQLIRKFLGHHTNTTHSAAPVRNVEQLGHCLTTSPDSLNTSPTVMQMANLTTPDYNWHLKMRATFTSPQLVSCQPPCECWEADEVFSSQTSVLQRGSHLAVKTNLTHHLMQEKNVSSICSETLLQIVLGMLNTHLGGKIYIGLSQSGAVEGVRMTRDQQDCFLLGFTKVVTSDITPSLLPCDSVVHFVPVVQQHAASTQSEFAYHVIILTVQPEPQRVYFPRDHPEKLYLRDGGVTMTLHGARWAALLSKSRVWAQELEQQVKAEKEAMLQLALSRRHQH